MYPEGNTEEKTTQCFDRHCIYHFFFVCFKDVGHKHDNTQHLVFVFRTTCLFFFFPFRFLLLFGVSVGAHFLEKAGQQQYQQIRKGANVEYCLPFYCLLPFSTVSSISTTSFFLPTSRNNPFLTPTATYPKWSPTIPISKNM